VAAVNRSDVAAACALLEGNVPACMKLLNPPAFGDFQSTGEGQVNGGVQVNGTSLLAMATQIACDKKLSAEAGAALHVVHLLVEHGANLYGCERVSNAVGGVVKSYVPGGCGYVFDGDSFDEDALSVLAGILPSDRPSGYQYGTAGCLPLHEALRRGSPELVAAVCTPELLSNVRIVQRFFDDAGTYEGQWVSLLAFVTRYREGREDGSGLSVLEFLVNRMGVSPRNLTCDVAGNAETECPVLHGLVRHAEQHPSRPLPAGYLSASKAMLTFLATECPRLLHTFDRDCLTAAVLAATFGATWFVEAVAHFAVALPGDQAAKKILNPVADAVALYQEDGDNTDTALGVTVPGDQLNPTKLLPAAAHAGKYETACSALLMLDQLVEASDCEHNGLPVPVLAANAATEDPAHLAGLKLLLDAYRARGLPLYDNDNSSPLHVAARCKPLPVVQCVAEFAAQQCPEMLTLATREGFTPLQVAAQRVASADEELAAAKGTSVASCRASRDVARTVAAFLAKATVGY
jgi:hypothetical protein